MYCDNNTVEVFIKFSQFSSTKLFHKIVFAQKKEKKVNKLPSAFGPRQNKKKLKAET